MSEPEPKMTAAELMAWKRKRRLRYKDLHELSGKVVGTCYSTRSWRRWAKGESVVPGHIPLVLDAIDKLLETQKSNGDHAT